MVVWRARRSCFLIKRPDGVFFFFRCSPRFFLSLSFCGACVFYLFTAAYTHRKIASHNRVKQKPRNLPFQMVQTIDAVLSAAAPKSYNAKAVFSVTSGSKWRLLKTGWAKQGISIANAPSGNIKIVWRARFHFCATLLHLQVLKITPETVIDFSL